MKKFLTTTVAILIALVGLAQTNRHAFDFSQHLTQTLLRKGAARPAAKTTSTIAERLIAQSTWQLSSAYSSSGTFELSDTGRFFYSSNRGSFFDFNEMSFSDDYWFYPSASIYNYPFGDERVAHIMYDKCYYWWPEPGTGVLLLSDSSRCTYDSGNRITEWHLSRGTAASIGTGGGVRYINIYDSLGGLSESYTFTRPPGATVWDSVYRKICLYASGKLVTDSLVLASSSSGGLPALKMVYNYDTLGNLVKAQKFNWNSRTSMWDSTDRFEMTYYSTNQLKELFSYPDSRMSVGLPLNFVDSFGWTSGIEYITYRKKKLYSSGTYVGYDIETRHINSSNLPDTVYTISANVRSTFPVMSIKTWYQYDSYGQPVIGQSLVRNDTTGLYDKVVQKFYFYYELYDTRVTAIASLSPSFQQTLDVYPNPFHNAVTLRSGDIPAGSDLSVAFYNMVGQRVWESKVQWSGAETNIPTETLPSGTYLLQATAGTLQFKPIKLVKD